MDILGTSCGHIVDVLGPYWGHVWNMFWTCFERIVNMIVTCCGHIKGQAKGIVQIMVELVMISAAYVD